MEEHYQVLSKKRPRNEGIYQRRFNFTPKTAVTCMLDCSLVRVTRSCVAQMAIQCPICWKWLKDRNGYEQHSWAKHGRSGLGDCSVWCQYPSIFTLWGWLGEDGSEERESSLASCSRVVWEQAWKKKGSWPFWKKCSYQTPGEIVISKAHCIVTMRHAWQRCR